MDATDLYEAITTAAFVGEIQPWHLEQIAEAIEATIVAILARWFDADAAMTWTRAAARFNLELTLAVRYSTGSASALHRGFAEPVLLTRIDNACLRFDLDLPELPPLPGAPSGTDPDPLWERWRKIVALLPEGQPVVAELDRRLSAHRTVARRRLASRYDQVRQLPEGALVAITEGQPACLMWQWRKLTCPTPTNSEHHPGELDALIRDWPANRRSTPP